ncbi:multiple epidermal growth factor-like domains 11 [Elysia marginata]|uniref:Multiple epidermal growth factor-like domains 11 n=1 Tax=Elysia marginata TaxID=1093978 RepID=A0AAV4GDA4_9GAST|nr:multiple epidermal growth factor-like domains 11 [Elysia marginata]
MCAQINVNGSEKWTTEVCWKKQGFICEKRTGPCKPPWVLSNHFSTCMRFSGEKHSWNDARTACRSLNGDLAVLRNSEVSHLVSEQIKQHPSEPWWIGAPNGTSNGEMTELDLDLVSLFNDGNSVSPNETEESNATDQECTKLQGNETSSSTGGECDEPARYICEKYKECTHPWSGDFCYKPCSRRCRGHPMTCHRLTGRCLSSCEDGYQGARCDAECEFGTYGPGCNLTCDPRCNGCDHRNGSCTSGCVDGYEGTNCIKKCREGTWGVNCAEKCSVGCKDSAELCYAVSGSCLQGCKDGYVGSKCDQICDNQMYGENCAKRCSKGCAGKLRECSHVDGTCTEGCLPGFIGRTCDNECPQGTWGLNCSEKCSVGCWLSAELCYSVNGFCLKGCSDGYVGSTCDQSKQGYLSRHSLAHFPEWSLSLIQKAFGWTPIAIYSVTTEPI